MKHEFEDWKDYGVCVHVEIPAQYPGDIPTLCGLTAAEHERSS